MGLRRPGRIGASSAPGCRDCGLDALLVDALHLIALVAAPEAQTNLLAEALKVSRSSAEPAAPRWEASLLNNLGMTHADAGEREPDPYVDEELQLLAGGPA